MMANKMKELDMKENSSKSLLANVLDMDDDFRAGSAPSHNHVYPQVELVRSCLGLWLKGCGHH